MKTKLFRILTDNGRVLAATFEDGSRGWEDARLCAMMFAERETNDLVITCGKAEEPFPSRKVILCPCCRQTFRLCHLEPRRQFGNKRCDCGTMFNIDWDFTGRELGIVDIDSDAWKRYLAFLIRQTEAGAKLGTQDEYGMATAESWLNNHKPGWKDRNA